MTRASAQDVLAGYYGFRNFGDDLFRDILERALGSTLWARPLVTQARVEAWPRIARNVRAIRNLTRARSVTLGGGSTLGASGLFGIRHVEMLLTRMKHIPYCAIGVGFLEGVDWPPVDILSRMSWVGLRSEREYKEIGDAYPQVVYMSDLAYAAPSVFGNKDVAAPVARSIRDVTIMPAGVGALGRMSGDNFRLREWVRQNVVPLAESGGRAKIILIQPGNSRDEEVCRYLIDGVNYFNIPNIFIEHSCSLETFKEISESKFVFTDRLHGGIISHMCMVPFQLSIHHKKCEDFLFDIGHPDAASADRGGGLARIDEVKEWMSGQGATVERHKALAEEGVHCWLEHLRERID